MAKQNTSIPLGTYDVFRDVKSWDEQTGRQWVEALNLRAEAEDQKILRARLINMAQLKRDNTVLEIGCGTGALLFDLAELVKEGHIIGIEPQLFLAAAARNTVNNKKLDSLIQVHTSQAEQLPIPDQYIDTCFAQTVLIHLPMENLIKALKEMNRVLKQGGKIISADQDGDTWIINHPERELTRRIIQFNSDQRYADGWIGRRLESLFRSTGLVHVKAVPHVHTDRTPDSYLFGMAKRIAASAKEAGVLNEDEYLLWVSALEDTAKKGDFFSSINYYCCFGIKP